MRQLEREKERNSETIREREKEIVRQLERERERDSETIRERDRDRERETERDKTIRQRHPVKERHQTFRKKVNGNPRNSAYHKCHPRRCCQDSG